MQMTQADIEAIADVLYKRLQPEIAKINARLDAMPEQVALSIEQREKTFDHIQHVANLIHEGRDEEAQRILDEHGKRQLRRAI